MTSTLLANCSAIRSRGQTKDGKNMAASNKAIATSKITADGLTVYDLDPQAAELWAVAGPAGVDPTTIDPEDLPDGFRWVEGDEWAGASVTIRNTNERYGDPATWTADTLEAAVAEMQRDVRACGPEFADVIVTDADYEIVAGESESEGMRS